MRFRRQALWVWYRGDAFHGFQWQADGRSVQQALEEALSPLGIRTRPMGASRTDRGVHARMQVALVKAPPELGDEELLATANAALGPEAGIAAVRQTSERFQPQWCARGKVYRYRLWLGAKDAAPPYRWAVAGDERLLGRAVDEARLLEALSLLPGTRDFRSLSASRKAPRERTISRVDWVDRGGGAVDAVVEGDSFGRYQLRILLGTAALVACGALSLEQWRRALAGEEISGMRAPASGLVLWSVQYAPELDPFSAAERAAAAGVPRAPPFDG